MTDDELIATLARLLRQAMDSGAWPHPAQFAVRTEARRAIAEADQAAGRDRSGIPPVNQRDTGSFW